MSSPGLSNYFNRQSVPFLASSVMTAALMTIARIRFRTRPHRQKPPAKTGCTGTPERTLWMTDTLEDSNGVAMVLKSMLQEVRRRDLPIDFVVASSTLKSGDHLIVLPPVSEFKLPFYEQQPIRMPGILKLRSIFRNGGYGRIICSTEGPMGIMALYLKYAYSVPANFYVHTDWMMFAETVLKFSSTNKERLRRLIRIFYRAFDGLFVLNTEQRSWLIGKSMGFDPSRVFLTAHWAEEEFKPVKRDKRAVFGVDPEAPVLLFAGRVSEEKGVMELPEIMKNIRASIPDVKIAIAGMGPAEKALKEAMPDAIYLGWVDHGKLPEVYSAADMLILPSRFDTFGCVVLEALSCGLPVTAYETKGPRDIISNGENGYLVQTGNEMALRITGYLSDRKLRRSFRRESLRRAKDYEPDTIISRLLDDLSCAA